VNQGFPGVNVVINVPDPQVVRYSGVFHGSLRETEHSSGTRSHGRRGSWGGKLAKLSSRLGSDLPLMIAVLAHKMDTGQIQLSTTGRAPCRLEGTGLMRV
jgi:hypothetical protein